MFVPVGTPGGHPPIRIFRNKTLMDPCKDPEGTNTKVTSAKGHFCAFLTVPPVLPPLAGACGVHVSKVEKCARMLRTIMEPQRHTHASTPSAALRCAAQCVRVPRAAAADAKCAQLKYWRQKIAHQKSTPQRSSWMFSGIFQWMFTFVRSGA